MGGGVGGSSGAFTMFVSMSLTTHAHVVSRCAIAASFACLLLGMERRPGWAFGRVGGWFCWDHPACGAAFLLGRGSSG